jgi:hypothetical protein
MIPYLKGLIKKQINSRLKKLSHDLLLFLNKINASQKTQSNALNFLKILIEADPLRLTKFEISFKIQKNGEIKRELRLLMIDSMAYSYSSPSLYLWRLNLYRKIIKEKIKNPQQDKVFEALSSVAKTPLDLYFGSDIKNSNYLFAFWLILGGITPDGKINFSLFSKKIIRNIFSKLEIHPPFPLNPRKILNLGFDIANENLFYKIYYLVSKREKIFSSEIKRISQLFKEDLRYWFYVSEIYDLKTNQCQRRKLFLEFLDNLDTRAKKTKEILKKILTLSNPQSNLSRIYEIVNSLRGKLYIISFEKDGTLTFYIRLND